jgi:hypothetical protein
MYNPNISCFVLEAVWTIGPPPLLKVSKHLAVRYKNPQGAQMHLSTASPVNLLQA